MEPPADASRPARDAASAGDSPFRRRWSRTTAWQVQLAGAAVALVLRLVYATLRVRLVDPHDVLGRWRRGERVVWTFWHDGIVLVPLLKRRFLPEARPVVMLSWHRDAEIAAQAVRRFGIASVRGSSTRGGLGALRGLLDAHRRGGDLLLVPDGPKGPRHVAKPGVAQVSRATKLPVVAVGAAAAPARRLGSWDRMQLPRPFARVVLVLSAPFDAAADPAGVQTTLDAVDAAAATEVGR